MVRVNLAKNPSFRNGTTAGYQPLQGATLSVTDAYAFYGKNAMVVEKTASNGSGVEIVDPIPVVANTAYAFSIYSRLPVEVPNVETADIVLQVEWLNSLGVVLRTDISAVLTMDDDSTWYRVGGVWNSPANATFCSVSVYQPLPGTDGAPFIVDALLVEQASYIGGYFDNIPQAEKNTLVNKALSAVPQVVNGVRLGADISLNGLIFNTIDEDDTVWVCTDLDGWWGQTSPELPDIARGTEDGSYDVEGRLTARTIALSGFFIPKDAGASLTASLDRLVSAINLVRQGGWLHAHEEPTKAAWVRLSSKPTVRTVNARGRTEFQIQLRAGDPIKYHWDDEDPAGFTNLQFDAADVINEAVNIGTATVSGLFTITGPVGAGTRVYNATTDETMTLLEPLRGAGLVADAQTVSSLDGVATIITTAPHGLRVGDEISLLNMVVPFSESDDTRIVTAVSEVFPYSLSFEISTDDIDAMSTSGQIRLVNNDVLIVDTYNRSVTYNGEVAGHRHRLTTLTDWIHFGPGANVVEFYDDVTESEVISKRISSNVARLVTTEAHYLIPGESLVVNLPEVAPLSRKKLEGNVVTLTTSEPHGFSVGDVVDVESTETSNVVTKSRTSNVTTLTTETPHGIAVSDQISVSLPTSVVPNQKELTSNVASLYTQHPHGLSVGDSITVALPTTATVVNKQLLNNQVILTTSGAHNFGVGDTIVVTMPSGASVTGKARSGSQVVITTASAHGFSVGDQVVVSLPETATPTGSFVANGTTNLVTVTTTTTHGFSVGDRVSIVYPGTAFATVTSRLATTTSCTITTTTAHGFVVGDRITVTSVGSRYNGTYFITGVTSTTITYASSGAAEASTPSGGTVTDLTMNDYNGVKIVESVPSGTTFTFRAWNQNADSTRPVGAATLTNLTNQSYNGTKTVMTTSPTTFAYNL